ncbi:hypothetical protein ACJIZ3_011958 [Penstemon smallii]|uniref:Uncharacterized protein n=1 Tax=Penstemon smallii TaxID=265156 RepID=A0ABD3UM72_9LAMI
MGGTRTRTCSCSIFYFTPRIDHLQWCRGWPCPPPNTIVSVKLKPIFQWWIIFPPLFFFTNSTDHPHTQCNASVDVHGKISHARQLLDRMPRRDYRISCLCLKESKGWNARRFGGIGTSTDPSSICNTLFILGLKDGSS